MPNLLLATSNPAKLARLRWVVEGLGFVIVTPGDLPGYGDVDIVENGANFAANAALKASAWSRAAGGMPTLATDGGLAIPALGAAWNALTTKRNTGERAHDEDRARHLLDLMRNLQGEDRRAIWHEAIAFQAGEVAPRTWQAEGDGGYIVETYSAPIGRDRFWTENLRYYPAVGKLYRDLGANQLEALGTVWPLLRRAVREYLASLPECPLP